MSTKGYKVSAFYKFIPIAKENLNTLKNSLEETANSLNVHGLFLIGTEGINATISGPDQGIEDFKIYLKNSPFIGNLEFKDSYCEFIPFRAFKVKIKSEIVTIGNTELVPNSPKCNHMSPEEWENALKNDTDSIVIDTRNWYETKIGKFKKAIDLNIHEFNEFPEKIQDLHIDKNKKILIYCTGGIRCEKAILEMQKQGFDNVHQLEGGILKYFETVKSDEWEGECFVFDRRVAVDKNLQPSKEYTFCPHCGQPAEEKIHCTRCEQPAKVCSCCLNSDKPELKTCSKNCRHHHALGNRVKRKIQGPTRQKLHRKKTNVNLVATSNESTP